MKAGEKVGPGSKCHGGPFQGSDVKSQRRGGQALRGGEEVDTAWGHLL